MWLRHSLDSRHTKSQTISIKHTSKENQNREKPLRERERERESVIHLLVACGGCWWQPWGLAMSCVKLGHGLDSAKSSTNFVSSSYLKVKNPYAFVSICFQ